MEYGLSRCRHLTLLISDAFNLIKFSLKGTLVALLALSKASHGVLGCVLSQDATDKCLFLSRRHATRLLLAELQRGHVLLEQLSLYLITDGQLHSFLLVEHHDDIVSEVSFDYFTSLLGEVIIIEYLQEVFEGQNFDLLRVRITLDYITAEHKQQALYKVNLCRKTKAAELLREFLRCQVPLLAGIPRLEDLLGEVHILHFVKHAHATVLSQLDPGLNISAHDKLLLVHVQDSFLLVLVVHVLHYLHQTVLGHLRPLAAA